MKKNYLYKFILLLICISMLFSFSACGEGDVKEEHPFGVVERKGVMLVIGGPTVVLAREVQSIGCHRLHSEECNQ